MATTYLKRSSRRVQFGVGLKNRKDAPIEEFLCPVCRCILYEPVTLPCDHNLCQRCLTGTFEHNSLACPLCRQRFGSWLRTATKSKNLINNELWEIILKRFPKQVENRHNDNDTDVDTDLGFQPSKKVLSAEGEIRREYETQLQKEREERKRQQENERLASEALIRKLHEEEQKEKLAQLEKDQLLAKALAKKEAAEKEKIFCSTKSLSQDEKNNTPVKYPNLINNKTIDHTNNAENVMKLIYKTKSDGKLKSDEKSTDAKLYSKPVQKNSLEYYKSNKIQPVHNSIKRLVKHQTKINFSNHHKHPHGSSSNIYGLQSKEELNVPNDILTNKNKKLDIEVCVTAQKDKERIGSSESAESHDSINPEIHHFKPIKILPRTSLKKIDGKYFDPKLIKVIPKLKLKTSNGEIKPPIPSQFSIGKFGCSWSAFKRIIKMNMIQISSKNVEEEKISDEKKVSTSNLSCNQNTSITIDENKLNDSTKISYDTNKNYTKDVNKVINGNEIEKKTILEKLKDSDFTKKKSKIEFNNGVIKKCDTEKKKINMNDFQLIDLVDDEDIPSTSNDFVVQETKIIRPKTPLFDAPLENIAERIKKRKTCVVNNKFKPKITSNTQIIKQKKFVTKNKRKIKIDNETIKICERKRKARKQPIIEDSDTDSESDSETYIPLKKIKRTVKNNDKKISVNNTSSSSNNTLNIIDDEILKEQKKIEQSLEQQKKDFEYALKLQEEFNSISRVSRTRRSKVSNDFQNDSGPSKYSKNNSTRLRRSNNRNLN